MATLPERIVELHEALARADLPHAFGGALALAWCTRRARGTIDIDVNLFVSISDLPRVLEALPDTVTVTARDRTALGRDGQARVWWERTPLDLFLNTTPFHEDLAERIRWERFGGTRVPFLACRDLAVFKAFFDRTKDWADLEEMRAAGTLDDAALTDVAAVLSEYLGPDDERLTKLAALDR